MGSVYSVYWCGLLWYDFLYYNILDQDLEMVVLVDTVMWWWPA